MLDRINEWLTIFLVGLGQSLSRFSDEETSMISLLLCFLVVAAAVGHVLHGALIGR